MDRHYNFMGGMSSAFCLPLHGECGVCVCVGGGGGGQGVIVMKGKNLLPRRI